MLRYSTLIEWIPLVFYLESSNFPNLQTICKQTSFKNKESHIRMRLHVYDVKELDVVKLLKRKMLRKEINNKA